MEFVDVDICEFFCNLDVKFNTSMLSFKLDLPRSIKITFSTSHCNASHLPWPYIHVYKLLKIIDVCMCSIYLKFSNVYFHSKNKKWSSVLSVFLV